MVQWTPEQEEAIYEKNKNILVAAAAGSGKTAVLVERIIERILDEKDPVNIDELLVVTFTNAAAEEMRQRIGEALDQALQEDPTSYHLKKQLSLLQKASISTIHSFCLDVVRQYSYKIDLDPAFRIADEMEIDLLKHEVLDDLFEDKYSSEGEELERFFAVVDMFSSDRSDVKVEELILRLHTFAKQHPWPNDWLDQVKETYRVSESTPEASLPWLTVLKEEIKDRFLGFKEILNEALSLTKSTDGPYHYEEALLSDLALVDKVLAETEDWQALRETITTSSLKNLSRKRVECDIEKRERVKDLRQQFRQELQAMEKKWFKRSLENHLKDMKKLYPVIDTLTELVKEFEVRFMAEKRKRALVDFNDLEHFSLQILIESSSEEEIQTSEIAGFYENQFKEILVDEYQDINLVQETIIQAIARKDGPGNVFMVGDVKQSIYRFRHAEPSLFIEKYEGYKANPSDGKRIDLAKNFRSRKNILDSANFIFKQVFDPSLGDIDYDEKASLVYGNTGYDQFPFPQEKTELLLLHSDKDTRTEGMDSFEELTNAQLEARAYAKKIKAWLGHDGEKPMEVYDKDLGRMRPITYKDIVILLRSMSNAPTIVEELKKQGIPVYSELRTGYFQAIEIQVMINMLKVIDNPYQDIPLASVLRSPIVGLNEEELAQIRLAQKGATFFEALLETSKGKGQLAEQVKKFLKALTRYRTIAREESLSELIWTIFQETGYYDFVGGIPGGRQRQANLRALYDRARSYEETSFRGLFRFLRFIERMEERDKDLGEARALSEQEDVVRIMTIHKSKGLEFPVVIVGEMNKEFNLRDSRGDYITNKYYGLATKYIDLEKRIHYSTLFHQAVSEVEKRELLSEEIRVLYVALTRAKEKLVLVGHVKELGKTLEKWQGVESYSQIVLPNQIRKQASSYLDWVGLSLIRHPDIAVLRKEEQVAPSIPDAIKEDPSKWTVTIATEADLQLEEEEEKVTEEALQKSIQDWTPLGQDTTSHALVEERLTFTYPYAEAASSRAKQSVTEIKRRLEEADDYSGTRFIPTHSSISSLRPNFLQKTSSLTSAQIGTAMHTVMQHLPFERKWDQASLQAFVYRLVEEEKLTEQEAEHIDIEAIVEFFDTKIGRQVQKAKVEKEVPFSYTKPAKELYKDWTGDENERVLLQGVIDCIVYTDDGIVLLDYKTDHIPEEDINDEIRERLKERYRIQISLYKEALENILQKPIKAAYLYFFSRKLTIEM